MENKEFKIRTGGWQSGIVFFSRISGLIIIPIGGAFIILKWLSRKYSLSQGVFIAVIGVALIFSFLGISREIKKELKRSKEAE